MSRPGVEFSPGTRRAILERDGFRCVRCGRYFRDGFGLDAHHRQLRSGGGMGDLDNGISLCGSGTTGCHGWVHAHVAESRALGWIVSKWADPSQVPWITWEDMRAWPREHGEDQPREPITPPWDLGDEWTPPEPLDGLSEWRPPE